MDNYKRNNNPHVQNNTGSVAGLNINGNTVADIIITSTLIDCTKVASLMGIGVSTVWAWSKAGRIPQPVKLGSRTTRWKLQEIKAHIESISAMNE